MRAERIESIKQDWGDQAVRREEKRGNTKFPPFPDVPVGRYTRNDFYELEQKRLWPRTWLLAGHTSEVPKTGSYKSWNVAGIPALIVRGRDDVIRAFYNVCQHRGSALVNEECGTRQSLTCTYHAWTYSLEGKLIGLPWEGEFPGVDKDDVALKPLRCELWGSFIFVNADPDAPSLKAHLGRMYEELEDMQLENVSLFAKLSYDLPCNWKCVQNAFAEGYHINTVHRNTVAQMLDSGIVNLGVYAGGHGNLIAKKREGEDFEKARFFDRSAKASIDPGHEITERGQRAYNVFPNLVIPIAMTQFPIIATWPRGPDACHVEVYYFGTPGHADPESEACKMTVQMFDVVTQEDLIPLRYLQASMKSGALPALRLGSVERLIYNHHEALDMILGREHIPEGLAVPEVLGPMMDNGYLD